MSGRRSRRPVQEYRAKDAPTPRKSSAAQSKRSGPHRYRWLFHAPPITGPGGRAVPFTVPEQYADDLGRHIERAGMFSIDALTELADADGTLNVHELPKAQIRHDPPASGPRHWLNPGPWVPADAPAAPRKAEAPDLTHLSDEEAAALEAEQEAIDDALRRRAVWREKLRQADPEGRAG